MPSTNLASKGKKKRKEKKNYELCSYLSLENAFAKLLCTLCSLKQALACLYQWLMLKR
jgi:hypothetical protein